MVAFYCWENKYSGNILVVLHCCLKKGLNIPNGKSEALNWRTDNAMDKKKWTKGQTMIYKAEN
jgi:hypothetical protein